MATPPARIWTTTEKDSLLHLGGLKRPWTWIARQFPGSTPQMCARLYAQLKYRRGASSAAQGEVTRFLAQHAAQLEDRARRTALRDARTDITASFFGDPLPGYSALDRRREATERDARSAQAPAKPTLYWGEP